MFYKSTAKGANNFQEAKLSLAQHNIKEAVMAECIFQPVEVNLAGTTENIFRGSRDKFSLLPHAFAGINQIGIIGWGSQAPAHALNLRDSLTGQGQGQKISIKVGLRGGSKHACYAADAGFKVGEMFEVISQSDMVLLLISDAAQAQHYREIFKAMKPGATLGLAHGFLLGHLRSIGKDFPRNINVIAACPKGMGPSVRRLYEQGRNINGAGINCSYAVHRDLDGLAGNQAVGWAIGLGAPYVFQTTLRQEYLSDLVGERGILLGGVWGMLEALFEHSLRKWSPETAFRKSVESLTGPISKIISKEGIAGLYKQFNSSQRKDFDQAFSSIYVPAFELLTKIYDEVASGNEIREVAEAGEAEMDPIDNSHMWTIGETIRANRAENFQAEPDPLTSGLYIGMMMAQVDLLRQNRHSWSETINVSVIEAVGSLNPYMHYRGVGYMDYNCSTTARRGARKWGPRFREITLAALDNLHQMYPDGQLLERFQEHPIHRALAVCQSMRPSVDIAVVR